MKIIGILVLLFGLFVGLIGLVGAVANFAFPPVGDICGMAESDYKKAQDAVKKYEDAKGTDDEALMAVEAKEALDTASSSRRACSDMSGTYKMYGIVFAAVAVVGGFFILLGAIGTFIGFRKKKKLA